MTAELIGGRDYSELIGSWVAQRLPDRTDFGPSNAIALVRGGRITVGVVYNNFLWPNICMTVAAERGSMWPSHQFLHHAFAYPFEQLGCRRVTALVASRNMASRKLCERLGFKLEGELRNSLSDDNELIYGLLKEECRWLGASHE